MTEKTSKALAFGDTAKFVTDSIGLKGCIVIGVFEDGRYGITTDGINGLEAQDMLAAGIYLNRAHIVAQEEKRHAA